MKEEGEKRKKCRISAKKIQFFSKKILQNEKMCDIIGKVATAAE